MTVHGGFELLAPAGNFETLKSAVANGADAVYIGGRAFSARRSAVNFSNGEIAEAVRFAHLYGAKVYAAVNTLVHDSELGEVFEFIKFLYEIGIDALIVQDLAVVRMVREYFGDLPIHASTQMTVHNAEGVKAAQRLGFCRVVLSRELSFEEIKNIHKETDAELEVFVHGALCMSYSGQCLMSSFIGCRSGNRGACAQPCRLPYSLYDANGRCIAREKYLLSLKDLCLADEISKLTDCGVSSFKIEGRMKSAEYVSAVTFIYNKYRNGAKVTDADMNVLKNIFSRSGFTKGYLFNRTGREMLNYNKSNDDVYSAMDKSVLKFASELKDREIDKKVIDVSVEVVLGECAKAVFSCAGTSVRITGNVTAERAVNVPLDMQRLERQFAKTGNTPFSLGKFEAEIGENVSLPISEINDIRRRGIEKLTRALSLSERESNARFSVRSCPEKTFDNISYRASVLTAEQAKAALDTGFDKVLIGYNLYRKNKKYFDGIGDKTAVVLPVIARDNREDIGKIEVSEVYVSNVSQLFSFENLCVSANYTMNVFNSQALAELADLGVERICLSPELNLHQIDAVSDFAKKELIIYGRVPLMTIQNCAVKSACGKCCCTDNGYVLKDRKGAKFPLFADKSSCTNTIYNSSPVYMADRLSEIPMHGTDSLRFIFTEEKPCEIENIFDKYKRELPFDGDFTRGHYYRGV